VFDDWMLAAPTRYREVVLTASNSDHRFDSDRRHSPLPINSFR
jgi:hypothetical protein